MTKVNTFSYVWKLFESFLLFETSKNPSCCDPYNDKDVLCSHRAQIKLYVNMLAYKRHCDGYFWPFLFNWGSRHIVFFPQKLLSYCKKEHFLSFKYLFHGLIYHIVRKFYHVYGITIVVRHTLRMSVSKKNVSYLHCRQELPVLNGQLNFQPWGIKIPWK